MSHHFDTPTAKEDPRLNVCDFYLFEGASGTTVMAMTVNPDAGLSAPETFRDEGLYAFRFDLNGDAREEITFKFRFSEIGHAEGDEHRHVQRFEVRKAIGAEALHGLDGEILIEGETGKALDQSGIRAFTGLAPELFAGDAAALHVYMTSFYQDQKYNPAAFQHRKDFFARRNVSAIVLEVPTALIGKGIVHAWATASLAGHAPEVQVSRWGLPLVTHIFLSDPAQPNLKEDFNRSVPSDDVARFSKPMAEFAQKMAGYAWTTTDPAAYGRQIAGRLCPTMLPYELGTAASFQRDRFNGRPLADDAMDVILALTANSPLADGVAPDTSRIRSQFPYFGEPYSQAEQVGVAPAPAPSKK
jgi:hypothetical protein